MSTTLELASPSQPSSAPNVSATTRTVAIAGNPNSGKSTLFNALTGLRQKVGNYPGVTVEKKIGRFRGSHGEPLDLLDLPGTYSLQTRSPDEAIARDALLGRLADTPQPDVILCVVDATNLERNLYLVAQMAELGLPLVVGLNMIDLAEGNGMAMQCLSTVAVVRRETNSWKWPLFQIGYMSLLAWAGAFLVFQIGHLFGFS